MPRIFISYSRLDQAFARRLSDSLTELGADVWMDVEDIPAGMKWSSAIQQGLDTADIMLVIISPDSMASRNVEDEWHYYLDNDKPILPVLLRPSKIHFQLNRIQYVDFAHQYYDKALAKLVVELRNKGVHLRPVSNVPTVNPTSAPTMTNATPISPRTQTPPAQPTVSNRGLVMGIVIGVIGVAAVAIIGLILLSSLNNNQQPDPTPTQQAAILSTATVQPEPTTPDIPPSPTANRLGFPGNPVTQNNQWQPIIRVVGNSEMALVPAGCFNMGVTQEQQDFLMAHCVAAIGERSCQIMTDQSPQTSICFDKPFWIDRTEITNQAYGSWKGKFTAPDVPRTNLNWDEAQNYCQSEGGRLPTEAEWEYAARGPDGLVFPWGNDWDNYTSRANICDGGCTQGTWRKGDYTDGYAEISPVGAFGDAGASWVGAYDMAGNVWEWTSSIYLPYPYSARAENNADSQAKRTLRGGSWNWMLAEATTVSRADHYNAGPISDFYGFRCVRDFKESDLAQP